MELLVRSLVGMFLPLFCVVYLESSNDLMPAARELIMLSRLLIVRGVEQAMPIIGVNWCLVVLRPRGSTVPQGSRIMDGHEKFKSTPPVHIRGVRHWKTWSLVWNLLFLLSRGPVMVWWWLMLRKPYCWALSLRVSNVVSSFSVIRLVSRCLGEVQFFGLPYFCPHAPASWSWYICGCWFIGCVSSISKEGWGYIAPKLSIIFVRIILLWSFPECLRSANITVISSGAPSPDRENYRPISITPILSQVHEKLVSHKLTCFWEKCVFFLLLCLLIGKVLSGLQRCTAYHISSPSEVLRCRDGVDSVLSICREFLSDRRQSHGWWCYVWVDPNRFRRASWKCVGSYSVYPMFDKT